MSKILLLNNGGPNDSFPKIQEDEQKFIFDSLGKYAELEFKKIAKVTLNGAKFEGSTHLQYNVVQKNNRVYVKFGQYNPNYRDEKRIVISVISFEQKQKGHGTALVSLLCDIAIKYNYQSIEIDVPNEESRAFGKKLGFNIPESEHANLVVRTIDLIQSLKRYKSKLVKESV